ncbi:MAG TPA: hypothetical protein VHM19_15020, partial [Polyangiales bacterium]|nr:hypothetical protein [Polyangiales bacterium]
MRDRCVRHGTLAPLLKMELRALGVSTLSTRAPDDTTSAAPTLALVTVDCTADQGLQLRVADLATHKSVAREMSVADVKQDARARALAIAIVELIESSWTELATRDDRSNELPP